jgi:hypothetical protein
MTNYRQEDANKLLSLKLKDDEKLKACIRNYIRAYSRGENHSIKEDPDLYIFTEYIRTEVKNKLDEIKDALIDIFIYLDKKSIGTKDVLNLKLSDKVKDALKFIHTELTEEDFL